MTLPDDGRVTPLGPETTFVFRCHPGVACFTECCRELELQLTPYDVIRLCRGLRMRSGAFLERHALVEFTSADQYPKVYLGMVDDGRATCPFVSPRGCRVYAHRPGACRAYPVGRGGYIDDTGARRQTHVLVREPHCQGFSQGSRQSLAAWEDSQGLRDYNHYNDLLLPLVQHRFFKNGGRLDKDTARLFTRVLYDLDSLAADPPFPLPEPAGSKEDLLAPSIAWLLQRLPNSSP